SLMCAARVCLLLAVCLTLRPGLPIHGEPAPAKDRQAPRANAARTDRYGNPLPEGAIARLGTVRFRDVNTIERAAFSPNGNILAPSAAPNLIRLWDVATGKEIRRIVEKSSEVHLHGFSPDGKTFAVESGGVVSLKEVATGREVRRLPRLEGTVRAVVFAPGGK